MAKWFKERAELFNVLCELALVIAGTGCMLAFFFTRKDFWGILAIIYVIWAESNSIKKKIAERQYIVIDQLTVKVELPVKPEEPSHAH